MTKHSKDLSESVSHAKKPVSSMDATTALPVQPVAPMPTALGPYRIEAEIGRGAMGAVYRAEHTKLKRFVALKILPVEFMVPDRVARFYREMEAIGRVDHPNIVRATDAGEISGFHYLAMELVTGSDFASLISRMGRMDVGSACEAVRQAALGLQHIHQNRLVHRDVKPSNLFLASDGTVKILDLGIAMLRTNTDTGGATSIGVMMGTPDYVAPEQIEHARDVDIRADIYSLGCTLFTLLTGNPPFSGPTYETHISKILAHRDHTPPVLDSITDEIPKGLSRIVARMMSKRPEDRYQTPADVAEAISAWADAGKLIRIASAASLEEFTAPALVSNRGSASPRGSKSKQRMSSIVAVTGAALVSILAIAVSVSSRNGIEEPTNDTRTTIPFDVAAEPLREVAESTQRISEDSHRLADTSEEIGRDTKRIAETLEDLREAFGAAVRGGHVIANPLSAGQFYHNARVFEQQGDYASARNSYLEMFKLGAEYVDVHQHFQSTLKLQEGFAGAREAYRRLPGDVNSPIRKLAMALLEEDDDRERLLNELIQADPDFAPAAYELSRCSSEAVVGKQSLVLKGREKEWLTTFKRLHEEGQLVRYFLDQSSATEMLRDADQRLAALQSLDTAVFEQPVSLTCTRHHRNWTIVFHVAETAREILYRLNPTDEFQSTGFIDHVDSNTGRKHPLTFVSIPINTGPSTLEVKYVDVAEVERGPYLLTFDPEVETARDAKRKLDFTKDSWVTFGSRRGKEQLSFTLLAKYRDSIREVKYAFDEEVPATVFELPDLNQPVDDKFHVDVPDDSKYVVVQVTFADGTQSKVVRFPRMLE